MSNEELLKKVKDSLGIGGDSLDTTIKGYIAEIKEFLIAGGVDSRIAESEKCAGIISRGVSDLWNYGAGKAVLSEYFMQRMTQLTFEEWEGVENGL